jgi:hypothetical protein
MSLCQICSRTPREIKTETTFCQWNSLTHSILDFCSSSGAGAGEEGRGGGMLKRNGSVLMKYLRGSDEKELTLRIQEMFQEHRIVKPKASRQESREVYLLCLKMRSDDDQTH